MTKFFSGVIVGIAVATVGFNGMANLGNAMVRNLQQFVITNSSPQLNR